MSAVKPKFRSRKLDFKRPLPIMRAEDIPQFDDMNRSVPMVATGVEKEEEEEHHLQAVMSAQASAVQAAAVYIPTPDASRVVDFYQSQYTKQFTMPKSLIRFSNTVEETVGPAVYCMDEPDLAWLDEFNAKRSKSSSPLTPLQFEVLFNELESLVARNMAEGLPVAGDSFAAESMEHLRAYVLMHPMPCQQSDLVAIHSYWLGLRRDRRDGRPVMPGLKHDDGPKSESDPFVCFRRREIRNTRKTRRTDVQSLQRLRQLKAEMESARVLVEMVAKREKMRREMLLLEHVIFEQRSLIQELKERLNLPEDILEAARTAHRKRNVKTKAPSPSRPTTKRRRPSEVEDDAVKLDPLSLQVQAAIAKRRVDEAGWMDATETPLALSRHPACDLDRWDLPVSQKGHSIPRGRYRYGRGGRLVVDRLPVHGARPQRINDSADSRSSERWRYDSMDGEEEPADDENVWYRVYGKRLQQTASNVLLRLGLLQEADQKLLEPQRYILPPPPVVVPAPTASNTPIPPAAGSDASTPATPKSNRSPNQTGTPRTAVRRKKPPSSLSTKAASTGSSTATATDPLRSVAPT